MNISEVFPKSKVHDFQTSLRLSHQESDNPLWEWVYRRMFPDFASMTDHRSNGYWQKQGIDRSLTLTTSKQILIDEKVRLPREDGRVFRDIALEYLGDEGCKTPGWVCKPLMSDYIAYLNKPIHRCYLLPVPQMQYAWCLHGVEWIERYQPPIRAPNKGWWTISVGVPVDVLFKAIGDCLRVDTSEYIATEDLTPGDPI